MAKVISIDPSGNGATAFITASVNEKEIIKINNFGIVDFGFKKVQDEIKLDRQKNIMGFLRHFRTIEFINYIIDEKPDFIILENFIQYKVQVGIFGSTFPTSELIGVIEYHCNLNKIPVFRVLASSLRKPSDGVYKVKKYEKLLNKDGKPTGKKQWVGTYDENNNWVGEYVEIPKPRKFKTGLTTKDLVEKGYLKRTQHNKLNLVIDDVLYPLSDYKVGTKNDHVIMALRHLKHFIEKNKLHKAITQHKEKELIAKEIYEK